MPFTFLHAADLHLGSPFRGLSSRSEDLSKRFADASRQAFTELIDRAIAEKVAFALISGDVYDGEWKDMSIGHFFNREIAKLARAQIPVFMIKGNHDAKSEVTKTLPLPESVHVFSDQRAESVRLDHLRVIIHGRSFHDRVVTENLARGYPLSDPTYFNIGMLHTSLAGNPAHETYAPCSLDDLRLRGYEYWALGHVHAFEVIASDPYVVYPGNLQGRSIRELGPKGAVFVDVDGLHVNGIRRVIVDQARFADIKVNLATAETEVDVTAAMRSAFAALPQMADGRLIAVRVRLIGRTSIHAGLIANRPTIAENAQSALHHIYEDAWLEKLSIETGPLEAQKPATATGSLLDTAALLAGLETDPDMRAAALGLIEDISSRWPSWQDSTKAEIVGDLDQLLEEARMLVLSRSLQGPRSMTAEEA